MKTEREIMGACYDKNGKLEYIAHTDPKSHLTTFYSVSPFKMDQVLDLVSDEKTNTLLGKGKVCAMPSLNSGPVIEISDFEPKQTP